MNQINHLVEGKRRLELRKSRYRAIKELKILHVMITISFQND